MTARSDVLRGVLKRKMQMEQHNTMSTKKQRVKALTYTAIDVMNKHLGPGGDISYDVADFEWEQLVQLTQQSERFDQLFSFPEDTIGWVKTKKKKRKTHLKIVAIDCEMCVTQEEGGSDRKSNALCRASAVDGENMLRKIVCDFIVHQPEPGFHMLDPKTDIHGITPEQIADCKITVAQAQEKMLKYINQDTIVVGHSVHGDLATMRISHRRVIDTSILFQRMEGNLLRSTPGLKDLTKFLLGFDMPQGHDSTIDAQASMMVAKYAVRHETGRIIPPALILHGAKSANRGGYEILQPERTQVVKEYTGPAMLVATAYRPDQLSCKSSRSVAIKVPSNDEPSYVNMTAITNDPTVQLRSTIEKTEAMIARSCRLRVHRIPKGISSKDIEKYFIENTNVVPAAVEKIAWLPNQNRGSCSVLFSSNAHAALAFESAEGPNGKTKVTNDSIGRPQKTIAVVSFIGKTYKNVILGVL